MADTTINTLKTHFIIQNQNKLILKDVFRHDLNLILCRKDGEPMPKSSLFDAFERILKRAEIKSLPIHSLRHTYVVLLMEAETDIKYIQKQLGHGSNQITADVYTHVSNKIKKHRTSQLTTERCFQIIFFYLFYGVKIIFTNNSTKTTP